MKNTSSIKTSIYGSTCCCCCKTIRYWIVNHRTRSNTVPNHYNGNTTQRIEDLSTRKKDEYILEKKPKHPEKNVSVTIFLIDTRCDPRSGIITINDRKRSHQIFWSIAITTLNRWKVVSYYVFLIIDFLPLTMKYSIGKSTIIFAWIRSWYI